MGTCWNCDIEITLKEGRTKCDNCGVILVYHCNNCKESFEIEDKQTKKKLIECKLCGYFKCPHCGVCFYGCQKYDWEKEILKILRPEITQVTHPNILHKVKDIVAYIEDEKSGNDRKVCYERQVPISYAKSRIKNLWAKVEGFRIKNENDRDAFIKRLDEVTEKPIGTELIISEIREEGSYGQEYRDAFNLLVCLGKLKIIKKQFEKNNEIIKYEAYIRCENTPCKFLAKNDLIINECPDCKKRFDRGIQFCDTCKPYKKGKEQGQLRKLKERLNDKDTCQMYRGDFVKIKF